MRSLTLSFVIFFPAFLNAESLDEILARLVVEGDNGKPAIAAEAGDPNYMTRERIRTLVAGWSQDEYQGRIGAVFLGIRNRVASDPVFERLASLARDDEVGSQCRDLLQTPGFGDKTALNKELRAIIRDYHYGQGERKADDLVYWAIDTLIKNRHFLREIKPPPRFETARFQYSPNNISDKSQTWSLMYGLISPEAINRDPELGAFVLNQLARFQHRVLVTEAKRRIWERRDPNLNRFSMSILPNMKLLRRAWQVYENSGAESIGEEAWQVVQEGAWLMTHVFLSYERVYAVYEPHLVRLAEIRARYIETLKRKVESGEFPKRLFLTIYPEHDENRQKELAQDREFFDRLVRFLERSAYAEEGEFSFLAFLELVKIAVQGYLDSSKFERLYVEMESIRSAARGTEIDQLNAALRLESQGSFQAFLASKNPPKCPETGELIKDRWRILRAVAGFLLQF